MTTEDLFPHISRRVRNTLHVAILQIMLLAVFGQSLSVSFCVGFIIVEVVVYFLGDNERIQNNMVVHVLCMSFTPILIALEVKMNIFSKEILHEIL